MLNVPFIPQGDGPYCLSACSEMVLRYYGLDIRAGEIRRLLRTSKFGTPFSNIVNLSRIGIQVELGNAQDTRPIERAIQARFPVICSVDTGWLSYWNRRTAHVVVVMEISETQVVLNDSAYADSPRVISLDEFLIAWFERANQYAILRPR